MLIKNYHMRYVSYEKEDAYYAFQDEKGNKTLIPAVGIILVDDGSDLLTIKTIATRKVLGYVYK